MPGHLPNWHILQYANITSAFPSRLAYANSSTWDAHLPLKAPPSHNYPQIDIFHEGFVGIPQRISSLLPLNPVWFFVHISFKELAFLLHCDFYTIIFPTLDCKCFERIDYFISQYFTHDQCSVMAAEFNGRQYSLAKTSETPHWSSRLSMAVPDSVK